MNTRAFENNNETHPTLKGYIRYRLRFFTGRTEDGDFLHSGCKRKINCDETVEQDSVGFFFEEMIGEQADTLSSHRITTSQPMMKLFCDAARFNEKVVILSYSWKNVYDEHSNLISRVIKVHTDGLRFYKNDAVNSRVLDSKIMSLVEIQQYEQSMELERKSEKKERKSEMPKYFNITGKVDAISTIIVIEPSDPFALMEIYDPKFPEISTVVVLKGSKALCCQPAILPGQTLTFSKVTRSRWHIPKSFQKKNVTKRLHFRAPSHVFVVKDAKSLQWQEYKIDTSFNSPIPRIGLFELPSTIDTLYSIQGRVTSIHYSQINHTDESNKFNVITSKTIHHIYIEKYDRHSQKQLCKLYLYYFPQSPDLHYGLEVGSHVCAINIHPIPTSKFTNSRNDAKVARFYDCFGACLRSTVTIMALTSDKHLTDQYGDKFVTRECKRDPEIGRMSQMILAVSPSCRQFYLFRNNKKSYEDTEWIIDTQLTLFGNLKCSNSIRSVLNLCLTTFRANISNIDSGCCKNEMHQRDPYKEWFDHACDDKATFEDDNIEKSFGCFFNMNQTYPTIIGLLQVRNFGISRMNQHLLKHPFICGSDYNSLSYGWTTSMTLDVECFSKYFEITFGCLYVGGIVSKPSHDERHAYQLEDGVCQAPLIPINTCDGAQSQPKKRVRVGDFCIVKLHCVVVTCFYIGKNTNLSNAEDSFETFSLPPLSTRNCGIKTGPCQLACVKGFFFIVSVQPQYLSQSHNFLVHSADSVTLESTKKSCHRLPITKFIQLVEKNNEIDKSTNHKFIAKLVGLTWRPCKLKCNNYEGCTMKLSFLPTTQKVNANILENQNTQLRIKIIFEEGSIESISQILKYFSTCAKILPRNNLIMAAAWREIAEDSYHCPLINVQQRGDLYPCSTPIEICFGEEALIQVQNGLLCTLDMLHLSLKEMNNMQTQKLLQLLLQTKKWHHCSSNFSNERVEAVDGISAERNLTIRSFHGIPTMTISSLTHRLLQDKTFNQSSLNLVFRIPNVQITTFRFCSIKIQCTKCFKYLIKDKWNIQKTTKNTAKFEGRHFWNEPFQDNRSDDFAGNRKTLGINSPLQCPSGCKRKYAKPKWELSGFIEDGTGLAKLYADQDAAIAFLGVGSNARLIEQAAWYSQQGVVYQKGILPISFKAKVVDSIARPMALKQRILIQERAYTELYYSARKIERKLDIICRAKYPTMVRSSLNQSDLCTIAALGKIGRVLPSSSDTNSLPFLELKLEDCLHNNEGAKQTGWSIFQSL